MKNANNSPNPAGLLQRSVRWLLPWFLITALSATMGVWLSNTDTMAPWDGALYDYGITANAAKPHDDVVIVGLTEEFIGGKHVKLLPREKLARLIESLAAGRPAVIGIDWWLDSWVDGDTNPRGRDAALRRAIIKARESGVPIVLNQVSSQSGLQDEGEVPLRADASRTGLTAHGSTLPYFAGAGSAVGHIDFMADADGINRDLPIDSAAIPSLPFLVTRYYHQHHKRPLPVGLQERLTREVTPIDFSGAPGSWTVVPADKVLQEPALGFLMADKIVLIGATFPRSSDFLTSPYEQVINRRSGQQNAPQRSFYGIELLANSTATILRGAPRHSADTPAAQRRVTLLTCAVAALVTFAALSGAIWGVGALLLAMLGTGALAAISAREPTALLGFHYWKASASIVAALGAFALSTAYRQITIGRELRRVRTIFDGYVGEEVLQKLGTRMPEMNGETWDVAVLFCDIEGFSALSEKMRDDPQRLLATLNEHFEPLAGALLDRGAYLDNYVGDLVMAIFGAPFPPDSPAEHVRQAVWAAIDFIEIIKVRNKERRARGEAAIEVGIGIHCGSAVVGNIGSRRRMHYTAVGDTVNLASRVESATRKYQTPLLVTEEVVNLFNFRVEELPPSQQLEWEFIDETTVKNREMPVRLYRPRVL